jgi:aldose 1-epimerase
LSQRITTGTFLGEKAIYLENDHLQAVIVPEVLRTPSSRQEYFRDPILYGNPVLFPPNRIADGHFTFNGIEYQFDINEVEINNHNHGFVHDKPWRMISQPEACAQEMVITHFDSKDYSPIYKQFPHHFIIDLAFSLQDNRLLMEARIQNLSDLEFPWGFGFHTTIPWPKARRLYAPIHKQWILNERNLPTSQMIDAASEIDTLKALDDVFLVAKTGKNELIVTDVQPIFKYLCDDNFTQWVFYNGGGPEAGFMSIEPYTWVTNAPNLSVTPNLSGLQTLAPMESRVLRAEIIIP